LVVILYLRIERPELVCETRPRKFRRRSMSQWLGEWGLNHWMIFALIVVNSVRKVK